MEYLKERLIGLAKDEKVSEISAAVKCRTKDGKVFTLSYYNFEREKCNGTLDFPNHIYNVCISNVKDFAENTEPESFVTSECECASIKKSDIVRIWAEIDGAGMIPPHI